MEEEEDKYRRYAHLPIPTYEEATSSRPTSSSTQRGREEISDDAERQGLLNDDRPGGYRPPTVESARSSEDSDLRLPEVLMGEGDEARRQIEELDYLDPSDDSRRQRGVYHRARLRSQFSKRLANLSATLSFIRLPSFRSLYSPVSTGDSSTTPSEPPPTRSSWILRHYRSLSIPEQYRISAPTLARLFGLFIIAVVVYILFALDLFPGNSRRAGAHFDPESVRIFVQENVDKAHIESNLFHITSFDHVAGTKGDFYLASWMQEEWLEQGGFDDVALMDYFVYTNYPTPEGRSVRIVQPEGKRWTAQLEEDLVDPRKQQTLAWHGYSKNGEATGHLIYVNGGSKSDFKWLKDHNVETEGTIALMRYDATQSDLGLKVTAADDAGCVGVLMFSDPDIDGFGKGPAWPKGRWRPMDSLQRGAVALTSWVVGDPLTPGLPSTKKAQTISKNNNVGLPRIPSLPLSWRDAEALINALKGQGVKVPDAWAGGTRTWFTGSKDGKGAPVVEIHNYNDENEKQQIWNVHGTIEGLESPKKKVIIGSHRDAWCFGSVGPGSGSAIMMEVASIFLSLRKLGWRPLRSIEFVSWDAAEYNLVGSTEYVEDNMNYLRENGVAYLNVDVGVFGSDFWAAASPLWRKPLLHVLGRVADPHSNGTLRKIWEQSSAHIESLGTSGDYVAFQDMAGTSSIDFGFKGPKHGYPSHSCYETYEWMQKFGDPGFDYHRTLAQIWALLILEIADRPMITFDLNAYAKSIHGYIDALQQDAEKIFESSTARKDAGLDFFSLRNAADVLANQATIFHAFEERWTRNVLGTGGLETIDFAAERLDYNQKIAHFETDLLDLPEHVKDGKHKVHGVLGREQYKHVIFGPSAWSDKNGMDGAQFPAVRDAMVKEDWEAVHEAIHRAAQILERAGRRLNE